MNASQTRYTIVAQFTSLLRSAALPAALCVLVFVITVSAPSPCLFAAAAIYNLGDLGGGNSQGLAINAAGQVAGISYTSSDPFSYHAFLYTGIPGSGGSMADLGTLGGKSSMGIGINSSGQVTGWGGNNHGSHAFLYTGSPGSGGVMNDLGTFGTEWTYSAGQGINDAGQVVGAGNTVGSALHAFLYMGVPGSGGAMADLGTLHFGYQSVATDINNVGQVTGQSDTGEIIPNVGAVSHAFLYNGTPGNGGSMTDLGSLGGRQSQGTAINDAGQVAGNSYITGDTAFHAFLYSGTPGSGGSMADLGTLGGNESYGLGINAAGDVVGFSFTAGNSAEHAFIYVGKPGVDGKMIDLDAWLDANNPIEGAKWTLFGAAGISDTGLITGYGSYDGGSDGAFLLDASALLAPEPSSLFIMAAGGLGLFAIRLLSRPR
jgi:probable HAF family extracellular repeat protein